MNTPQPPPVFSDDGMWWWDGRTWQPAVSPDGRWRWDGWQWRPAPVQAVPGQSVSQPAVGDKPASRAMPRLPGRVIKVGALAAAVVALVGIGSLLLTHMHTQVLSPQMVSRPGYTLQVPAGWSWYRQNDAVRPCGVALRPVPPTVGRVPDSIVCGPHQEGSDDYYAIFVYTGISLDYLSFKPPIPLTTPGYDSKIPFAFPGATKGQEVECTDVGTLPMWCWHIPGGQQSDSVDRDPPLCGSETLDPTQRPANIQQIGRYVSVSHGGRDYLIVLGGYHVPARGFPDPYCSGFYQLLKSWKWQG